MPNNNVTNGGWKAIIIWDMDKKDSYLCVNDNGLKFNYRGQPKYYVIHKPKEEDERPVITHNMDGEAMSILSVGEPPQFGKHHPADLKEIWKKDN